MSVTTARPVCAIRLGDRWLDYSDRLNPGLIVGEAFMDGRLTMADGPLYDFLDLSARNFARIDRQSLVQADQPDGRKPLANTIPSARPGTTLRITTIYPISSTICFWTRTGSIPALIFSVRATALTRRRKTRSVILQRKLLLTRPRLKVLDIGSGWGGHGVLSGPGGGADVTGVTLSVEQHRVSEERAAAAGLAGSRPVPLAGLPRGAGVAMTALSRSACSSMSARRITSSSSAK